MKFDAATLDAHYSTAVMSVRAGVPVRDALRVLQQEWYGNPIAKASTPGGPGDHGISEIGAEERALYDTLVGPQREAFRNVQRIINAEGALPNLESAALDATVEAWKRTAMMGLSTQAMRGYLVGQMLASEKLGNAVHGPLKPLDFRNMQFLQNYTFNEVSNRFEDLKATMRRRLIEGSQLGLNPKKVARLIAGDLNDYKTNWELIAITETARAESQGRLQEFADEDIAYAIGSTAHDMRVCPKCQQLIEGQVVSVADTVGVSNYGKKQADWVACIPLHPRCRCVWLPYIPGETRRYHRAVPKGESLVAH